MAKRRTPSQAEAKKLLFSLYTIDHYEWSARDVREGLASEDYVWHSHELSMELRWVLDQAVPTFLVIKLAAVVEECTAILWDRRFPEIRERKFSLEEKLTILQGVHEVDVTALRNLWTLRNRCAHSADNTASWDEYRQNFKKVWDFIDQFAGKINWDAHLRRGGRSLKA